MDRIVPLLGVLPSRPDYRTVVFSDRSGADIGALLSTFETRIELPDGVQFCRTTDVPRRRPVVSPELQKRANRCIPSRSPLLANETVAVSVPRRIGFAGPRPSRFAGRRTPRPPFALPLLTAARRLGDMVPTMPMTLVPRGTGGPHAGSARLSRSAAAVDRPPRRSGRASRWVPRAWGKSLARIPQRGSFPGDFAAGVATTHHPIARMLTGI